MRVKAARRQSTPHPGTRLEQLAEPPGPQRSDRTVRHSAGRAPSRRRRSRLRRTTPSTVPRCPSSTSWRSTRRRRRSGSRRRWWKRSWRYSCPFSTTSSLFYSGEGGPSTSALMWPKPSLPPSWRRRRKRRKKRRRGGGGGLAGAGLGSCSAALRDVSHVSLFFFARAWIPRLFVFGSHSFDAVLAGDNTWTILMTSGWMLQPFSCSPRKASFVFSRPWLACVAFHAEEYEWYLLSWCGHYFYPCTWQLLVRCWFA